MRIYYSEGWGEPPRQPHRQPPPPPPQPPAESGSNWWRYLLVGAGALLLGVIGAQVGADSEEPAEPAEVAAVATPGTPGSCLRALDLAEAGQATPGEGEYGHVANDCREQAAPTSNGGGQPAAPAPEPEPEPAPEPEPEPAEPQPVTVPDVVHFTYADATDILEEAGVPAESIDQVPLGEDSIAINPFNWIVLEVVPGVGETWNPGDTVRLGIVKRDDPEAAGIQPRLE